MSSVCHGTAGIVNLKNKQGNSLYQNRKISGFPDLFENKEARYYQSFPFSIQEKIKENGGQFQYSDKPGSNFYIVDGRFITGQDPSAAASVAEGVITILGGKNEN